MFWKRVAKLLRALYFVRVSLIIFAVLPLLGWAAAGPMKSYLEGLFDIEDNGFWGLVSVAAFATLTGAAAVTTLNLTLWYGRRRFRLDFADLNPHRFPLIIFLVGVASAAVLYVVVCLLTPLPGYETAGAGVAGFLIAAALVLLAKFLQLWFTDPVATRAPPPYLVFPMYVVPGLNRFFNRVYLKPPGSRVRWLKQRVSGVTGPVLRVVALTGPGYLIPGQRPRRLYSGHVFAISLAVISLVVYYLVGLLKQYRVELTQHYGITLPEVPSLSYVLLAIMVFGWTFSGLAFFLDRYRFPVLLAFFLLTQITSTVPASDHYFRVEKRTSPVRYASAAEVLKHFSGRRVPVLVAAAGGGIQAGAWEAEVLRRIARACAATKSCELPKSLAMISGVSGGSIGAMQVGAAYPDFDAGAKNARRASLDDVAWGWVNPDVWRAILPWFRERVIDRGWALEVSQEAIGGANLQGKMLSDWAARTPRELPALLLNATTVENGAPLVFATSQFSKPELFRSDLARPDAGKAQATSAMSFDERYGHALDIRVATAARMSASFPYVTPAARALGDEQGWHIVDGGYYDNYGLFTLMDWLTDGLEHTADADLPRQVLIVRITAFPAAADAVPHRQGWGFQTTAPLSTFLNVRTDAQAVESEGQLQMFERYWGTNENPKKKRVPIADVLVEYPSGLEGACAAPPLSWKLTEAQKKCIAETAWDKSAALNEAIGRVVQGMR